MIYSLNCGGYFLRYKLNQERTSFYFDTYLKESSDITYDIEISKDEIQTDPYDLNTGGSDAYLEYRYLMVKTGNELLKHHRCLFHGMAFLWKGYAWVFTGHSGVGKTTQYRLWNQSEDIQIINGDKPILEIREKAVWVYSSAWRGKERLGIEGISAPLGGIIFLEQGDTNSVERLMPQDCVLSLFGQFISYPENTDIICMQAEFLDTMLSLVPVWKLTNRGDIESVKLTRSVLEDYYGNI